ncbi:MAG: RecX family transcriptional regulator [Bacteroidetes bacterium]|nr:RecX family transcriptional regulator [Bacteroidota bacterium]
MQPEKAAKKITDPVLAYQKISNWCAYQERCQQEVRDKLYEFGLWPDAVESLIAQLIQDNFLNEERFARSFARGKFRIKKWGKQKIKIELKRRKVSDYSIRQAMKEIDDDEYLKTLRQVIATRRKQVKEPHPVKLQYKLVQYAMSRGFERDLAMDLLKPEEDTED